MAPTDGSKGGGGVDAAIDDPVDGFPFVAADGLACDPSGSQIAAATPRPNSATNRATTSRIRGVRRRRWCSTGRSSEF